MMLLFSTHITPRLCYIIAFISKELFDDPAAIRITDDAGYFGETTGPRFNYSEAEFPDCFRLRPNRLLFEQGIHPLAISCFIHNGEKAFFPTDGDLPFDILA